MLWREYLKNNYRKPIPNYQYMKVLEGIFQLIKDKEYEKINELYEDLLHPDSNLDIYVCLLRSTFSVRDKVNHSEALEKVCSFLDMRGIDKTVLLSGMN